MGMTWTRRRALQSLSLWMAGSPLLKAQDEAPKLSPGRNRHSGSDRPSLRRQQHPLGACHALVPGEVHQMHELVAAARA